MSRRAVRLCVGLLALVIACSDGGKAGRPPTNDAGPGGQDGDPGVLDGGGDGDASPDDMDAGKGDGGGTVATDKARVVSVAPTYAVAEEPYKYGPKSSAPGKSEWKVAEGPSGMTVDDTGVVAWEPTKGQGGQHKVKVETVIDDKAISQTTTVTVATSEKRAEGKVSKEGGSATVSAPKSNIQGAGVSVTKGAVSGDTTVTVSELDAAPKMAGKKGESRAVHFGPSGTVFTTPALVSLPLPRDVVLEARRLGAYVYDPRGRWQRVPVVRIDLASRVIHARAAHFSTLLGSQSALGLTLSVVRMPPDSACEGALSASAVLDEPLSEVDSAVVNNADAALSARIESGASDLDALLFSPDFRGSLRFVRVLELLDGDGETVLERAVLVSTLFAPGDGSATLTHGDALGNVVATLSFESLVDDAAEIALHLRGEATHARFTSDPAGAVSVAGRLHVLYFEGDASLDPAHVEELGLSAVDQAGALPTEPVLAASELDVDCDTLDGAFDELDGRLAPGVVAAPRELVSALVGTELVLSARTVNVPGDSPTSWELFGGAASLRAGEASHERRFVATEPGRFQVEFQARVASGVLSHLFVIDVLPMPAELPSCTPVSAANVMRVGESASLTAVLGASTLLPEALEVEWGLWDGTALAADPGIAPAGMQASFTPAGEGAYSVACRVHAGELSGPVGRSDLTVVPADANRLPVDLTLSPSSSTLQVGESLTLLAAGLDLDGDALTFAWSASGGTLGEPQAGAGESRVTFSASTAGQFTVRVAIGDGDLSQELSATILVVSRTADLEGADADRDGWPAGLDCDDGNAVVNPGIFDACGDAVDDDCSGAPRTEDCDGDGQSVEQGDCDDANPRLHEGAVELCDGLDNDCSGARDDGFAVGKPCGTGEGACLREGTQICTPDGASVMCDAAPGAPGSEVCNLVDDDCDGQVDEGYVPTPTSCGLGACAATGQLACVNGEERDSCQPGVPAESDQTCDLRDEDCDGSVDEDFVAQETSCGVGMCARTGARVCTNGVVRDTCQSVPPPSASDTGCDGRDDDCSGAADEDFAPLPISCGLGVCQSTGLRNCVGGELVDSCSAGSPTGSDSSCDGVDQDCSGVPDDGFVSLEEVCNGRDDDCDGQVDENLSCTFDPGTCEPTGTEVCNLRDDDCDGQFDEGDVCGLTLEAGSIVGVWWTCASADCAALNDKGLMFLEDGILVGLGSFDQESYDPALGPYCSADDAMSYLLSGTTLTVSFMEGGESAQAIGEVSFEGTQLNIDWTLPPENGAAFEHLVRVPEQAGGSCSNGPTCQPHELCGNGFDDDCDGQPDGQDPECTSCSDPAPEICDGLDNDCSGAVDDLRVGCQAPVPGVCQRGQLVCDPVAGQVCAPGFADPAGELCPDGLDNDCDGEVDEAGCTQLSAGETCFNAIDVSAGGTFQALLGERDDAPGGCRPEGYRERVFVFRVPPGPGVEYSLVLRGASELDVGAALIEAPASWSATAGCPLPTSDEKGACFGGQGGAFRQYLSGGSTYLLYVESSNVTAPSASEAITLAVAYRSDGVCFPGSADGDAFSICDGDCDDAQSGVFPGASEVCNGRDDDCDGLVDEQSGSCSTGQTGACGLGVPSCAGGGSCLPIHGSTVDYCDDGTDNDCDGSVDEACVTAPGEACSNAMDLGTGGTVFGTLQGRSDDALSRCRPDGSGERELFHRFTVPTGGARLFFDGLRSEGVRFALYRGCDLDVVSCDLKDLRTPLEAGEYVLAVEEDTRFPGGLGYGFTLGLGNGETCNTPDQDGDGLTVCDGDCNESDALVYRGASEGQSCDQLDNDCNGSVDDVSADCQVSGRTGVCQNGRLRCLPGGQTCEQVEFGDAAGRDFCNDDLDNDCDGLSDASDPQGCVDLPPGEVCSLPLDVSQGGRFVHSLAGYQDDAYAGCGDRGGYVERYYAITLSEPRRLFVELRRSYETDGAQLSLLAGCGTPAALACTDGHLDMALPPGNHLLAVYGPPGSPYELTIATSQTEDFEGTTCLPGDTDGDGFTLCNGDCNDDDFAAAPTSLEVCDGVDNDCDRQIDEPLGGGAPETCSIEGAVGLCTLGSVKCLAGELDCVAAHQPGDLPEICQNDLDEDCDGLTDDTGVAGTDCFEADGETCQLAMPIAAGSYVDDTLAGATHEGGGCYGGVQGDAEEKYYQFEQTVPGYVFMAVVPTLPGKPPPYSVGIFGASCDANPQLACVSGASVGQYYVGELGTHHVVVESDEPFAYQVQLAQTDERFKCLTPDQDGDGRTLCEFDCNDANAAVFPGHEELCDGRDNDCDGNVDNLPSEACETTLPGICAAGHRACDETSTVCVPNQAPRAIDLCGDGLDNDCDGLTDEVDCEERPAGETCELAVDASLGGVFVGSLLGKTDDGGHCSGGSAPDTFFSFVVEEPSTVYLDVVPLSDPGGTTPLGLSAHLFTACSEPSTVSCAYPRLSGQRLEPGTYNVAVEANREVDFQLLLAFDRGAGCEVQGAPGGDFDGDGVTLCAGDCNESDAEIGPHADEVCNNGRDDDCNGYVDYVPSEVCTSAQPGECASGRLSCPQVGSQPVCIPDVAPDQLPELCGDGLDNDCTDGVDEAACVQATGASCTMAIQLAGVPGSVLSRISDPIDDAPGCVGGAEMVYRVTAPETGYLFAAASPLAGTSQFLVRSAEDGCYGPAQCHVFQYEARPVVAGQTYFLVVEGPMNEDFRLTWALRPGDDRFVGPCFDGTGQTGTGDFDGDGVSLCDNDCNEASPDVHGGADEICGNGIDDDCDAQLDQESGLCNTGLSGVCEQGTFQCTVSGEPPACEPIEPPRPEQCNGLDDDCDGQTDEDCVPA